MKVTYTANDGKVFNSQEECIKHEMQLSRMRELAKKTLKEEVMKELRYAKNEEKEEFLSFFSLIEQIVNKENSEKWMEKIASLFQTYLELGNAIGDIIEDMHHGRETEIETEAYITSKIKEEIDYQLGGVFNFCNKQREYKKSYLSSLENPLEENW